MVRLIAKQTAIAKAVMDANNNQTYNHEQYALPFAQRIFLIGKDTSYKSDDECQIYFQMASVRDRLILLSQNTKQNRRWSDHKSKRILIGFNPYCEYRR